MTLGENMTDAIWKHCFLIRAWWNHLFLLSWIAMEVYSWKWFGNISFLHRYHNVTRCNMHIVSIAILSMRNVKGSYRFGIPDHKNICSGLLLAVLWPFVAKLYWNLDIARRPFWICRHGRPGGRPLRRPQKFESLHHKQHLCQISCL